MSTSQDASNPAAPPAMEQQDKPARNPLERILVWGLILVGAVIIFFEGRARLSFSRTWSNLQAAMEEAEGEGLSEFSIDDVPPLIVGNPTRTDETKGLNNFANYEWSGLVKKYGLRVRSGVHTKLVTGIIEANAPLEEPREPIPEGEQIPTSATQMEMPGSGGGGGAGGGGGFGGGGGGGGQRRDPMEDDKDGDGKLSREEATGRMAENFDVNDANSDGFIDQEEIEAMRERFRRRREEGGGGQQGGFGPPRPEESTPGARESSRPPLDTETPAEEPKPEPEGNEPTSAETEPASPDAGNG